MHTYNSYRYLNPNQYQLGNPVETDERWNPLIILQFVRINPSSLINIEKNLNRLVPKFCNSDHVNVIAVELRLTKTRPTSFYKKQSFTRKNANRCRQGFEN